MIGFQKTRTHLETLLEGNLTEKEQGIINALINMLKEMLNLQDQLSNLMKRFNDFIQSKRT